MSVSGPAAGGTGRAHRPASCLEYATVSPLHRHPQSPAVGAFYQNMPASLDRPIGMTASHMFAERIRFSGGQHFRSSSRMSLPSWDPFSAYPFLPDRFECPWRRISLSRPAHVLSTKVDCPGPAEPRCHLLGSPYLYCTIPPHKFYDIQQCTVRCGHGMAGIARAAYLLGFLEPGML